MKLKISVLPGDGIGPEVTREAVRILRFVADLNNYDFDSPSARSAAWPSTVWFAAAGRDHRELPEEQRCPAGRRGIAEIRPSSAGKACRSRSARPAQGARGIRQSPSCDRLSRHRRLLAAERRDRSRRRHHVRPRVARRPVLRRAPRIRWREARSGLQHHALFGRRDRARRPRCF